MDVDGMEETVDLKKMDFFSDLLVNSKLDEPLPPLEPSNSLDTEEPVIPINTATTSNHSSRYKPGPGKNSKRGSNIFLKRVSERIRKVDGFFWSGHMVYYTNLNITVIQKMSKSRLLII